MLVNQGMALSIRGHHGGQFPGRLLVTSEWSCLPPPVIAVEKKVKYSHPRRKNDGSQVLLKIDLIFLLITKLALSWKISVNHIKCSEVKE